MLECGANYSKLCVINKSDRKTNEILKNNTFMWKKKCSKKHEIDQKA